MFFKFILYACLCAIVNSAMDTVTNRSSESESKEDTSKEAEKGVGEREVIRLTKTGQNFITKAAHHCLDDSEKILCYFKVIKKGEYLCNDQFKDFWFCVLTRTKLVDKKTGLFNANMTNAIFPPQCKTFDLFNNCPVCTGKDKHEVFWNSLKYFQDKSPCLVNLVPDKKKAKITKHH